MGDFIYSQVVRERDGVTIGEHSITIDGMNTWNDWHMAPKSRPFVVAPSVKESYVDVPAADGSLDYTEVLAGKARYANRVGTWEFIVDNGDDYQKWNEFYSDILLKLHGKRFTNIILEDDPLYYWKGRLTVQGQFGNKDYSSISIGYNLEPYKWPMEYKGVLWWQWKELFSNNIIYGPFSVNGFRARNLINEKDEDIIANLNVTYVMNAVRYDGSEVTQYNMLSHSFDQHLDEYDTTTLFTGDNPFRLHPGNNFIYFVGHGSVTVEYERGKRL